MFETENYSDFIKFKQTSLQLYWNWIGEGGFNGEEINRITQGISSNSLFDGTDISDAVITTGGSENSDDSGTTAVVAEYRRSKISWVPKTENSKWLYEKIGIMVNEANENLWNFDIVGMTELIQYTEYDQNYKGHYDWHMDVGDGENSKRKISLVLQLSDPSEYEGGELELMISKDITTFRKEKGSVICFPSFFMHRVKPVTRGNRKSLVIWISGPPYR